MQPLLTLGTTTFTIKISQSTYSDYRWQRLKATQHSPHFKKIKSQELSLTPHVHTHTHTHTWILKPKAVVRAMDTMADFAAKKVPSLNITKFVVAGASKVKTNCPSSLCNIMQGACSQLVIHTLNWCSSTPECMYKASKKAYCMFVQGRAKWSQNLFTLQRGWTTWTTGIVDKRVIGIAPIVEDLLNLVPVSKCSIPQYIQCIPVCTLLFTEYASPLSITWRLDVCLQRLHRSQYHCLCWRSKIEGISKYSRPLL